MLAKFKGTCSECHGSIAVGEEISWSRQERGKVYHAACAKRRTPAIETKREAAGELLEALKSLLALQAAGKITLPVPEPDEPDASEYEPEPKAAKAELKTKPATPKVIPACKLNDKSKWYDVFKAILPYSQRILLYGPPGPGKSTTARILGDIKLRVTMTPSTSKEDLIGGLGLADGATRVVDGPFTIGMRTGQPVLLDEVNLFSPEAESCLYSLIDDKPHVCLPGGEIVEAKPGYACIMTCNGGFDTLCEAVQDRIEVLINANTPHADALTDVPDCSEPIPEALRNVCIRHYESKTAPTLRLYPTVRRIRAFWRLMNAGGIPADVAANHVFGTLGAPEILSALTSAESTK